MKHLLKLILISLSLEAFSDDLLSIYNEALDKDPEFNSKKADLAISKEFLNQSRSNLLPQVRVTGGTNWNEYYQDRELQNDYNTFSYGLNISQQLFMLDKWCFIAVRHQLNINEELDEQAYNTLLEMQYNVEKVWHSISLATKQALAKNKRNRYDGEMFEVFHDIEDMVRFINNTEKKENREILLGRLYYFFGIFVYIKSYDR